MKGRDIQPTRNLSITGRLLVSEVPLKTPKLQRGGDQQPKSPHLQRMAALRNLYDHLEGAAELPITTTTAYWIVVEGASFYDTLRSDFGKAIPTEQREEITGRATTVIIAAQQAAELAVRVASAIEPSPDL